MTGIPLIVAFVVAIIAMIWMISQLKIHPFLSIMAIALVFGLLGGIPLVDVTDGDTTVPGIATVIGQGFSSTFTSIGIVIILGALIGTILEVTGGAFRLADAIVGLIGKKRPVLAIQLMGWIVSIPVFCDSGFVILNPIRKALAHRTATSSVAMTVALSAGLYTAHVFIPPTPGPIAAANTLGLGDHLLLVIGLGALVSIPALIASYFYARYIGTRIHSAEDADLAAADTEVEHSYEQLRTSYGTLPSTWLSFAPIIVPILAMALGSVAAMVKWTGPGADLARFVGTPIIALAIGTLIAVALLARTDRMTQFYEVTNDTLKVVGPILFITAAGGVLGRVIANTDIVDFITDNATTLASVGLFFPFLLSAILKTAQGSSTVALVTTAGIVAPLLPALGLQTPVQIALAVMAVAAGAMTVSHANDSYFWVVTNFGGMTADQGYRTQTVVTLIMGVVSILFIWILSLFLG